MLPEDAWAWIGDALDGARFDVEDLRVRPWSTTARIVHGSGVAWFKACAPVQRFECAMTDRLHRRWPGTVAQVVSVDEDRGWLLLADAGTCMRALGNDPRRWLTLLPAYGELQRGEADHVADHLAHGVPDLRTATLGERFAEMAAAVPGAAAGVLGRFEGRFARLCDGLAAAGVADSVQHDDLHDNNVFCLDGHCRVLDWGDSSIGHPFFSLVVPFRFLEQSHDLNPGDAWWRRLRDAYLEPWGPGWEELFEVAVATGEVAHLFTWVRQRRALPAAELPAFDGVFDVVIRRATAAAERLA